MSPEIILSLTLLVLIFAGLVTNRVSAEFALFFALTIFVLSGILTPGEALKGFSNEGVIAVGLLFIVSEAVKKTGNLEWFVSRYLAPNGRRNLSRLLLKLMLPITLLSAFINNTPVVTIFTPVIKKWAEKIRLSASKFLIPLSYAAIFGGWCTLIGTSTNLLIHGLLLESGERGYGFFELAWVGIPCAIAGMLYMALIGRHLLPDRADIRRQVETHPKEYVIEMKVLSQSVLAGRTIAQAGLRNLKSAYLMDIEREGRSLGPVSSATPLSANDRLIFVGAPSGIVDLQEIPGLVPSAHKMFEADFARMRTHFIEAVVSSGSPVLGKTVKECEFRARYGAGVVAVHRNGARIEEKVGSIRLKAGDTLLLFADEGFLERWRDSQDFYLISLLKDRPPNRSYEAILTFVATFLMILMASLGDFLPRIGLPRLTLLHAVMAAALVLITAKCIEGREIGRAIRWNILLVIAMSIGVSAALEKSGTADWLASGIDHGRLLASPTLALTAIYFLTVLIAEMITHSAAAAIIFPIALAAAHQVGVDPRPFVVAVTIAASAGFASPLAYQTHLIVQGPGGYKFTDYLRVGLLLDLLIGVVALLAIRSHWPF